MRIVVTTLLGCTAMMAAGTARAQVPDKLVACASRVDDADRLACYDAAVKSMGAEARAASEAREAEAKAAKAAAAASAAAAAEAAAVRAEAERQASFGKPAAPSDLESELQASITKLTKDRAGTAIFVLDNGQIWRQADALGMPNVKVGTAVTIKRGALGSFRLVPANSKQSVRVVRTR